MRDALLRTMTVTSVPQLLGYEDKNSMHFAVEYRVPFLAPKLATYCLSLPNEYIVTPDGLTKAVFGRAMRGVVPDAILDRRAKIGFATPKQRWLSRPSPWVAGVLPDEALARIPALNAVALREHCRMVESGTRRFDACIWHCINFVRWAEIFDLAV